MSGCSPAISKPPISLMTDEASPKQQQSSVSTSASSSTNSSPTTTISTVESMHITPDSSPDSPAPFRKAQSFSGASGLSVVPPSPGLRPLSPSKKPRNTKNLSLNMPPPTPGNLSASGSTPKSVSAPPSPAFIPPPPPTNPRRRPSNLGLTIKLPATLPAGARVNALRHHVSSPSLLSPALKGPPGGMTLPQSANPHQTTFAFNKPKFNMQWAQDSAVTEETPPSPRQSQHSPEPLQELEEEEEPRSGEVKPPAYPNGPACIFDPNIYLYAEPDAALASQFDVVINVAREVRNPFHNPSVFSPAPDTAATDASFQTAFEDAIFSPMSAKARFEAPKDKPREPEYVHMPWDHNTPILDDLPRLVKLIESRSAAGKKVLVHCQCGVSRSATLLIAYGMYKNPTSSMQDAYNSVKERSRWIGPNMSLIYQLTDWKKKISAMRGIGAPEPRGGVKGCRLSDPTPEPLTAPLPDRRSNPIPSPLVFLREERNIKRGDVSPGPSSAPPGMSQYGEEEVRKPEREFTPLRKAPKAPIRQTPTSVPPPATSVPQVQAIEPPTPIQQQAPPPLQHTTSAPLQTPVQRPITSQAIPLSQTPTPPSPTVALPSLFSPRTLVPSTSFPTLPSSSLAQTPTHPLRTSSSYFTTTSKPSTLAAHPNRRSGPWGSFVDPRSPEIGVAAGQGTRNIWDVL